VGVEVMRAVEVREVEVKEVEVKESSTLTESRPVAVDAVDVAVDIAAV